MDEALVQEKENTTSIAIGAIQEDKSPNIIVRTSRNTMDTFQREKIVASLMKETSIDETSARMIALELEQEVSKLHLKYITAPLIREIVNVKLLEHGFESARMMYTRLGMPVYDARQLIFGGSKENANLQHNPETVHKLMADVVSKEYSLVSLLPPHLVDAHMKGDIHIHDLDYFATRPFCFSHDLRFFLKNGLKVDGTGKHTSIAGPAKRPEVAFLHAAKALAASQTNCFHKDEPVVIEEDGRIKVEKISKVVDKLKAGKGLFSFGVSDYKLIKQPIIDFNEHDAQEDVIEIGLENGKSMAVLASHPLFIFDETRFKEILAENIEVGDYVPVPIKLPSIGTIEELDVVEEVGYQENLYIHDDRLNFERSKFSFPKKIKITKELMRLLGYYVSEGNITCHEESSVYDVQLSFGSHENMLIEDAKVCIKSVFGFEVKVSHSHPSVTEIKFGGKLGAALFEKLCGRGAKNKRIPWIAFNVNEDMKMEFLKSYFDGDGHSHKDEIIFDTVSRKLASDLSYLLLQLGLISRIRKDTTRAKEINGRAIKESQRYRIEVQIRDFDEIEAYRNYLKTFAKQPVALQIPTNHAGLRGLYAEIKPSFDGNLRACLQKERTNRERTKQMLVELKKYCSTEAQRKKIEELEKIICGDIGFLRVRRVNRKASKERFYDITTPTQTFVGCFGGILVHNCAGGQGFSFFNTFLAPQVEGLDLKHVKQMAQMFIYEMSQMYVARGGQTVFSSIDMDIGIPKKFRDVPAVQLGGVVEDSVTYADYEDESRLLFDAFVDVYYNGDYQGKPFNFPKLEVQIRPNEMKHQEDELLKVAALSAKFGTPYYIINQPYMPEFACYQCCSYLMPLNDANTDTDVTNGTIRGGALQVVTINLPKAAYDAMGNDERLFEVLRERMELAKEVHLLKREIVHKNLKSGLLPFMQQPIDGNGTPYLIPDKQSFVIGMVGMNELLKAHTGMELHESPTAWTLGLKVMNFMRKTVEEFRKQTGLNFSLARTPAESTAYRFASIDLKNYGERAVVQGNTVLGDGVYYTNSFHVRPGADVSLFKRMEIEGAFHPLTTGGAMSHVWLGEANPDPVALHELTKKIATKTAIQYFAYTKDFSICPKCDKVAPGLENSCPNCSSTEMIWWSRITGYYQSVSGWNKGKVAELRDRKRYGLSTGGM